MNGAVGTATVRLAGPADAEAVVGLIQQLGYDVSQGHHVSLMRAMLHNQNHAIFVADLDNEVVGYLNVNFRPFLRYAELIATIDELCVDERFRRHGVGRLLIETALQLARTRGAHHLELTTNKRRVDALDFYRSLGFDMTSYKLVMDF